MQGKKHNIIHIYTKRKKRKKEKIIFCNIIEESNLVYLFFIFRMKSCHFKLNQNYDQEIFWLKFFQKHKVINNPNTHIHNISLFWIKNKKYLKKKIKVL